MQKITWFLFLFVLSVGYSQESSILQGKIIADSLQFDAIHVINKTTQKGTISDKFGYFKIKAALGDVLVFSSIQYAIKRHVVSNADLELNNLKIKLERSVNELDEVVVTQYSLTGKLVDDLQEIPTYTENLPFWNAAELKQMGVSGFDDAQSPVKNLILERNNNQLQAKIDLELIFDAVSGIFRKRDNQIYSSTRKRVDYYDEKFIVEILEVPETEYYNFIDFVNEDSRSAFVFKLDDDLKILEYLIEQRDIFIKKYNIKQ